MSDNRKNSNVAVEQIIGNMTSGIPNAEGQYVQLGFTPPPSPSEAHQWNTQGQVLQNPFLPHYNLNNTAHNSEVHTVHPLLDHQIPAYGQHQVPFTYMQQPQVYDGESYDAQSNKTMGMHPNNFVRYQHPNVQDLGLYPPDYQLFMSQDLQNMNSIPDPCFIHNQQESGLALNNIHTKPSNSTHLLENLVGNWVPNTSGTYSPFGNMQNHTSTGNIFKTQSDVDFLGNNVVRQVLDEPKQSIQESHECIHEEVPNFQFNRNTKKPRIVAEVKPMRPSYSDVLAKSAPQSVAKSGKPEAKDTKQKKENNKKNSKSEKVQKLSNGFNRSTANIEAKDTATEKCNQFLKSNEKSTRDVKPNQLNRKWASLNNVNESFSELKADGDLSDVRKSKRSEDSNSAKNTAKFNHRSFSKNANEFEDTDSGSGGLNISKNAAKRGNNRKPKSNESFGVSERPPGKRGQRNRKRENHVPFGVLGQKFKQYMRGWWKIFLRFVLWIAHLISDICSLSVHLSRDMIYNFWKWLIIHWALFIHTSVSVLMQVRFISWLWEKIRRSDDENHMSNMGLSRNIPMPSTGEEAMKRLLACKGKDPYSILGVSPTCTDDDIKKYYKRQAFLVHPDKNQQPGAEEAFKILVHAFDMIGETERRAAYDRGVAESAQVEQTWSEVAELLAQLHQKVEAAANTIRCSACGLRHKRIKVDRPSYAARNCGNCKIHHAAREGDIWAEAKCFGFLWHYFACMDGDIYDITEWAGCQRESLKHLRPDSHHVQYRIALGKQNGHSRRHNSSPRSERPPDLENLLNSLYGQSDTFQNSRRRNKKSNK